MEGLKVMILQLGFRLSSAASSMMATVISGRARVRGRERDPEAKEAEEEEGAEEAPSDPADPGWGAGSGEAE